MEFKDMSPELKEKVRGCETPEEILSVAKEECYELTDEQLQALSSGMKITGTKSKNLIPKYS